MAEILTIDDKKYLRKVCNYLGSLGMNEGTIRFEIESYSYKLEKNDFNWENVTTFDNNYRSEIPDGLKIILKKIVDYLLELDMELVDDVDDINYQDIEFVINCEDKSLSVFHRSDYYATSDGDSVTYDDEEDKETIKRLFSDVEITIPDDGILTVDYSGGGDSGYIESSFSNTGGQVPTGIEDWCSIQLESNFGAWGNNEGSQGNITFNLNDFTAIIVHTDNYIDGEVNTLFEEKF
jgi:hypothetical protein